MLVLSSLPATAVHAQTATTLVSNADETLGAGSAAAFQAQSFYTGSSAGTYTLSSVEIRLNSPDADDDTSVKIREDDNGEPGDLVGTLTNPATWANGFNTFTAPAGTTLGGNKTYWLSVNEGIASGRAFYSLTAGDGQTSTYGWTIGNNRSWRTSETADWNTSGVDALVIRIKGTVGDLAASGAPDIEGTPQVGQTLTAGEGDMADANGLPMTTFPTGYDFQWVRVDGGTETDIGTNSDTYEPVAADVGKTLKVKVSFTDGGNTKETLTSEPTAAVLAAAGPCPTDADWCTTLTVGVYTSGGTSQYGYRTGAGDLDNPTIDHGGESWTVSGMLHSEGTDPMMAVQLPSALPANTVFNLGGTKFALADATETTPRGGVAYGWDLPSDFAWLDGQKVTVSANLPPTLVSAAVDGTSLVLTHAEDLDTGSTPPPSAYEVTVAGSTVSVSGVSVSGTTVTLTLASAVTYGQTVTVSYTPPGSMPLRDASGVDAPALTDETVANSTRPSAPTDCPVDADWCATLAVGESSIFYGGLYRSPIADVTAPGGHRGFVGYGLHLCRHRLRSVAALSGRRSKPDAAPEVQPAGGDGPR